MNARFVAAARTHTEVAAAPPVRRPARIRGRGEGTLPLPDERAAHRGEETSLILHRTGTLRQLSRSRSVWFALALLVLTLGFRALVYSPYCQIVYAYFAGIPGSYVKDGGVHLAREEALYQRHLDSMNARQTAAAPAGARP